MSGLAQQLDQVRDAPTAPDQRPGDRPRGRLIYRHTALVRATYSINVVLLTITEAASPFGRFCCKSRKSNDSKNLAKVDFQTTLMLKGAVVPIGRSVVVFPRNDVVPNVATCNTRQRL